MRYKFYTGEAIGEPDRPNLLPDELRYKGFQELLIKYQETPLFFCVSAKEWADNSELPDIDQLSLNLESIEVCTLGVLDINSFPALVTPVNVPVGTDKENCTAHVSAQIQSILKLI